MNDVFNDQQREVLGLLKTLSDNQILEHIILAGSWAEYVYAQSGLLPGFSLELRTLDIDFLIKNLKKPTEPISIPAIASQNGYSIAHDVLMGTTKLFSPGGLEIEFLIPQKGSGAKPILETNLGVNAQALRHMDLIISNAITVNLFGMELQVPSPESYVLHKMLINDVRTPVKQIKDRDSILRLLPHINFEKLNILYEEYSKNEKKRVNLFLQTYRNEMGCELDLNTRIKFNEFVSLKTGIKIPAHSIEAEVER